MIWLILGLLMGALVVLVIHKVWLSGEKPLDPAAATRAAIDLHAISRRIDADLTKREQRQNATRARREIAEALDDGSDREHE
jgi:hypothetical protein